MAKKIYKVQCAEGHIVTVVSESDEFQVCLSEEDCGAAVIIVSNYVEEVAK